MKYEGTVYRPPSDAHSLIIQVAIGCSHNKCTFCMMYKDKEFRIRDIKEIFKDLEMARKRYSNVKRIFLADGNALALRTDNIKKILNKIKDLFPECERVGIYSSAKDILKKGKDELKELSSLGIGIVYMGIESGNNDILKDIKKGVTSEQIIQAGKKIKDSNIKLSITIISGIGGKSKWKEHAIDSARAINAVSPDYIGLLALRIKPETELYDQLQVGDFNPLTPKEVILETIELIKNLDVENCVFRNNHAANYFFIGGNLPYDKDKMLRELNQLLNDDFNYDEEFESYRRSL